MEPSKIRILYISNHDLDAHNGVVQKIKAQTRCWLNSNEEVYIFSTPSFILQDGHGKVVHQYSLLMKLLRLTGPLKFIFMHVVSILAAGRVSPSIIYSRYFLFSPFLCVLNILYPVIYEINGDDNSELRSASNWKYYYNLLTRDFTFLSSKAFVFVTDELRDRFAKFHKSSLILPNGVDDFNFNEFETAIVQNDKINIGFSGTANQSWHGLDKIMHFIRVRKEFHLHVVGSDLPNEGNITFYGRVDSFQNKKILNSCDICVSTLAIHRAGLSEASPLKSREYVLLGKPIIYAYDDYDLDPWAKKLPNYFFKLKNSEDNVSSFSESIELFMHQSFTLSDSEKIKDIGRKTLTYVNKERRRLSFFKEQLIE